MKILLSQRVQRIKPSATLAVSAKAMALQASGKDIINLGVGEPDFDTPDHVKRAAIQAIENGFTKYTAGDGMPSLKQAIIRKFQRENQLNYAADQILVSCGCKHSIFNAMLALLNDEDEVIIPAPYWVSYPDMAKIAGGLPVIINTEHKNSFKLTAQQLEAAITPKTRLLILNSPSNPTGIAYRRAELKELAKILLRHPQVFIASDDIYEHIYWANEPFINILNVCPELEHRTLIFNGVSKSYAMTGWRIGYTAGPKEVIAAMNKVQSQSTSNPTSISQVAAQAALDGDQSPLTTMNAAFKERYEFVYRKLIDIKGIECEPADGAFYLFPSVQKIIDSMDNIHNDIEFSEYLLDHAEIAVVPGSAFGAPGHIRLSFATNIPTLEKALERFKKAVN